LSATHLTNDPKAGDDIHAAGADADREVERIHFDTTCNEICIESVRLRRAYLRRAKGALVKKSRKQFGAVS
jgi:hypothetical protein